MFREYLDDTVKGVAVVVGVLFATYLVIAIVDIAINSGPYVCNFGQVRWWMKESI